MANRKRTRSPQEKKRLSLERDRPVMAEYPKAFRRNWPRKKAYAERARRHNAKQQLSTYAGAAAAAGATNASATDVATTADDTDLGQVKRERVVKWGTSTLGEVIPAKIARRAALQQNPRNSPAARERRRRRRSRTR